MKTSSSQPDYLFWPSRDGYDFQKLYATERQAVQALRRWHFAGETDATILDDLSLGWVWRYGLLRPVMTMFRQAARGVPPDSPDLWDAGMSRMYRTERIASAQTRRYDWKAIAFRAFLQGARSVAPKRPKRSALVMGSPSNRNLWREWLEHRPEWDFSLDFFLAQPPGLSLAVRAALNGAWTFDPTPDRPSPRTQRRLEEIRETVQRLPHQADWRALFDCGGVDLSDAFKSRLLDPFIASLESLAGKYAAFSREFDRLNPSVLILPQEVGADAKILIHLAKTRSVPFWFLNHGFPGAGYSFDQTPHCGDLSADRILAWGSEDRENYVLAGADPQRIVLTGNPAFDTLLPAAPARPFQGVRGATVLVVAQTNVSEIRAAYFDDAIERFFFDVIGLLDSHGAAKVIYKLHPGNSKMSFYEGLRSQAQASCTVELSQEESFESALSRSDFAIGPSSTAIFETLLAGKDYFFFNNDPVRSPHPFGIEQSYVAKTINELADNLTRSNPIPRTRILRDFCGLTGNEGPYHSTRKVLSLLQEETTR